MTDHPRYPGVNWDHTVRVTVFEGGVSDTPFWNRRCEGTVQIFQEWLAEQIAKIPPEFLHSADIEISSEGGYEGEHHATIEIEYTRPMTPPERAAMARENKARADERRRQKLAQYDALKRELKL